MILVSSGWACHSRAHFLTCGTPGTATSYLHSSQRSRPAELCSHSPLPPLVSVSIQGIYTTIKPIRQTLHCISWKGNKSSKVLLWILTSVLSLWSIFLLFPIMFFSFRRKWQEMLVFHQRNQKALLASNYFSWKIWKYISLFWNLTKNERRWRPSDNWPRIHLLHIQQ